MKKGILFMAVLVGLLFAGSASAGEGVPVGNAVFYPSIELVYFHTDNVFLNSETDTLGEVSDSGWIIRPQILFDVPFNESFFRFGYMLQWKEYDDFDLSNDVNHRLNIEGMFKSPGGHSFSLKEHFVRGVQETNEFDPYNEVNFGNANFDHNMFEIGARFRASSRSKLEINLAHEFVNFDNDGQVSFYEWDQWMGALTWRHNYLPMSDIWIMFRYKDHDMDEFDNMSTHLVGGSRDHESLELRIGWNGYLGRNTSAFANLGWKSLDYDRFNMYDDFSGIVGEAGFTANFTEFAKLDGKVFRDASPSAFNVNNYYTATGLSLTFQHQPTRNIFWSVGFAWQENDYPEYTDAMFDPFLWTWVYSLDMIERNDDLMKYQAEIGIHILKQVSLRLNFTHTDRDSNLEGFKVYDATSYIDPESYDEDRFAVQIQVGW